MGQQLIYILPRIVGKVSDSSILLHLLSTYLEKTLGDLLNYGVIYTIVRILYMRKTTIVLHRSAGMVYILLPDKRSFGCEGDLAATSVTPLIARVDSADLAG